MFGYRFFGGSKKIFGGDKKFLLFGGAKKILACQIC